MAKKIRSVPADDANAALPPQGSEFDRHMQSLEKALKGARLTSLTDERVESLAGETGIDREHVRLIRRAAQMAERAARSVSKTGSRAPRAPQAELFYGLLRQNALHTKAGAAQDLEAAARRSVEAGIIAPAAAPRSSLRAGVTVAKGVALLERAAGGPASLGDVLATIPSGERLTEEENLRFAGLYATHGSGGGLWKAVERTELRARVPALKRTLALQQLTGSHAPMVAALQARRGARDAESTAYLAAVSPKEWRALVSAKGAPDDVAPDAYADRLQTSVERAHPAAALSERLKKNDVRLRNFTTKEVKGFLASHPDFDFRAVNVEPYLDDNGIKSPTLRQGLKRMSRALTLAGGRIDAAAAIVDAGYENSHQIMMAGPDKVKALLSDTVPEEVINTIVRTAADKSMKVIGLASSGFSRGPGKKPKQPKQPARSTAPEGPTLRGLFGSMDFCECRHCRSVLGPAAYFADLLHCLETLPVSNRAGKTALDGILARRPDLQHLELSCENTNTEIPYVDLILEVLENAVALPLSIVQLQVLTPPAGGGITVVGGPPAPAPATVAAQLQEGEGLAFDALPDKVQLAVKNTAITTGDTFDVKRTVHDTSTHESIWAVSDGSRRWELQHRTEHLRVWEDLPGGAETRDMPELSGFAAVKAEFQRGHLHQRMIDALAPEPLFPVKALSNVVPALVPTGAAGGRATLIREIALEFPTLLTASRTVKVFDYAGTQLGESAPLDVLSLSFASDFFLRKTTDPSASIFLARSVIVAIGLPAALIERASVRSSGGRFIVSLSQTFLFELVAEHLSVVALAYQDSSILTNLAALPENRNPEAYQRLRNEIFPWTLPFDLALEETRAYLAALGVSRRTLLELLTPPGQQTDALAADLLGLSEQEWKLIAPPAGDTPPSLDVVWGVYPQSNWLYDEHLGSVRTGTMQTVLRWVSVVMQQSRLSYRELLEVLQTVPRTIRPTIHPENECEPSQLQFRGGSLQSTLLWIHRIVRLWRHVGWSIRAVDRALAVFQRRIDEPETLRGLALMQRLCGQLGASPLVVAGILGELETQSWTPYVPEGAVAEPSLYHKLFQHNALRASQSFSRFTLKANGQLSAANTETLSGHAEFISAALGIAPADVLALSTGSDKVVAADTLTLDNIELLYGVSAFARRLSFTIGDFLRWQRLLAPSPAPFALTAAARAEALLTFTDDVLFARSSGQSLDELEYLLLDLRVGDFANAQKDLDDGVLDIHSALRAGDVLSKTTNENLRTQLLRAGAPADLAAALTSSASLEQYLWAEITFAWTGANPAPAVPAGLAGRFDWTYDAVAGEIRFSCRGFVETAAFDQVPLAAQRRTALRRRYELIRDIVASQIERVTPRDASGEPVAAPWFSFTFQPPAPVFNPPTPVVPADFASFLTYDGVRGSLALTGYITQAQATALKAGLDARLAPGIDGLRAQSSIARPFWVEHALALDLLRNPNEDSVIARVLRRTAPVVEGALLSNRLAAITGIEQDLCDALLDTVRAGVPARPARTVFFDDGFLSGESPESAGSADQLEALARFEKAGLLLKNAPLSGEQTAWLFGGGFSVLEVNKLPVGAGAARASLADWRAWRELIVLAQSMKNGLTVLQQLGAAVVAGAAQPNAILRDESEVPDLQQVVDATTALNMTWPGDFRQPARLAKLITLLHLMKRLGCGAGLLKQLSAFSPSDVSAMAARGLFMSQFDSDTLAKRMEPVSNTLRARQRDALIDYLRTRNRLRDADQLLDYYLIDVQMGTCMRTSRLKQAISSVQLYIQRCLLGLERVNTPWPVAPHHINTRRWDWMKNYRVWEANRKVFLYPENWIEPELRDDKTEIFRALESELMQEDLTHESSLGAFRNYLESASDIARPVIVAMWAAATPATASGGGRYRVHIVARDRGTPHKYLYRTVTVGNHQATNPVFQWRPWETIDGEFPSGHVLVCELDGLPYVLSPSIERADSGDWKIHLEASKRTARGWFSVKKSLESFTSAIVPGKTPQQSLVFRPALVWSGAFFTVRVDCFVANVLSGEKETPDQQGIIDRTDWEEEEPQRATEIRVRVLDKYKDPANPQNDVHRFNSASTLLVTVNFTLEWWRQDLFGRHEVDEVQDKDYFRINGVVYDPAKTATSLYTQGICNVFGRTLESLIAPDAMNWNRNIAEKCALYFKVKQITSIEVSVNADPARYTAPVFRTTFNLINFGGGSIFYDLICTMKDGIVPNEASSARTLEFSYAASFEFDESRALILRNRAGSQQPVLPAALGECEHFGSGFRSASPAALLRIGGANSQSVLTTSFNTFIVALLFGPAAPYGMDLGAYSDSRVVLYFLPVNNRWRALPEGQTWVWNGLRALGKQAADKLDLESLPADFILPSPPRIPYDVAAQRLDSANSPGDLALAFDQRLPASTYDWETFFHVPLLIAVQLSQAQRFEEARRWFHTIFDPTSNRAVDPNLTLAKQEAVRYWSFPPFRAAAIEELDVDDLLEAYARGTLPQARRDGLEANIEAWKDNPFNPHLIARFRTRSYMWAVVIKYVQNLIAWGDQLFRRDTIESINEATQLYVLGARILGPRPQSSPRKESRSRTYAELARLDMDQLTNVWSDWEDRQQLDMPPESILETIEDSSPEIALSSIGSLYFCIPHNAGLSGLWDTLEQRLFNIRHCRNIEGVERTLPLFEPPIDPALLVRAAAAGLPISDVLAGFGAPLPVHRFSVVLPKAMELCADVRALGAAVLSAFEKKDAEELALLRNSHEMALLKLTEQVRLRQIDESKMAIEGLEETRRTAEARYSYYQKLLDRNDVPAPQKDEIVALAPTLTGVAKSGLGGKEQGLGISPTELDQLRRLSEAQGLALASGISSAVGGVLFAVGGLLSTFNPKTVVADIDPGSALTGFGHAMNAVSSAFNAASAFQTSLAGRDGIIGGYERRRDDWVFQSNMALRELAQIDKQTAAAEIRKDIAEKELGNTRAQIENARSVDDFFKSKYASAQLYRYMSGQLVSLYFRTYQLAVEVAKGAERCFQFELGQTATAFVKPAYWDSARKGLLSGEQLHLDLRRMDLAYLESHKREYEITKHVSLVQLDPLALIALRQNGRCEFAIPEVLFDLDCPGHYMRRIKSVSVTMPCLTGPYTGVHCTLTLLSSSVRKDAGGQSYEKTTDDSRFVDDFSSIQSIVTSGAQADAGLFETNLREERYLPFEGAGAISTWRLELPAEIRQFDYDTISDVILHVRYTARDGGAGLKQSAASHARTLVAQVAPIRLFSMRHEFPSEWARFKSGQDLDVEIKADHYPFWTRGTGAKTARGPSFVKSARTVSLLAAGGSGAQAAQIIVTTKGTNDATWEATLVRQPSLRDLYTGTFKNPAAAASELKPTGVLSFHFANRAIDDLWLAIDWSVAADA